MTSRQKHICSVIEKILDLHEEGKIESLAFAIVQPDGVPILGHANPTYSLLGTLEQTKLAMGSKMLRDANDAPGFEDTDVEH